MTNTILFSYAAALSGSGLLWWLASRLSRRQPVSVPDALADVPVELRTAVSIFTDPANTNVMLACLGLGSLEGGFPKVDYLGYTVHGLEIDILMLGGQSLKDWNNEETLAQFATYLGVPKVTALSPESSWVRLQVRVYDTLATPAAPPEVVPDDVDLEAVPVGVTEDYDTWRLRVLYSHILLAGATGSGKSGVLWALLYALGPAIKAGLVDVWMADPKGGMEFGRGRKLFVHSCWDAPEILAMLNKAVEKMAERAARLREAGVQKHVPTVEEPLILVIIDEAAALSSFATKDEREEFRRLSGLLLSQGRAVGVSVFAALQDPSKETMPNRQLFPVRVGLRLDEDTQVAMVHGQGAKARGARCHEISARTPGVGYVGEDGNPDFVRVRAFLIEKRDIDWLVEVYAPDAGIDLAPQADYSDFDPDDLGEEKAA
ncbi:FtsK/SpoIIIE domain-containing protein [Nocardia goodfellowii]